jgi:uncharacterized repeat protein (TIGR03803 family)
MVRVFKYLAVSLALSALCAQPAAAIGTAFRVAYSFRGAGDGSAPRAGLVMDATGLLYGTSQTGGAAFGSVGNGTLFRFDPAHEVLTVLHRFTSQEGSLPAGTLAFGTNGHVFGTLATGGAHGCGTVFDLNPATLEYATLHSFGCDADGGKPVSGVVADKTGMLYGETTVGGSAGPNAAGTIFALNPANAAFTVLHSFNSGTTGDGTGGFPLLPLNGALYGGTCIFDVNPGAVFKLQPATGDMQIVHQFTGKDGYCPTSVVAGRSGVLFGSTLYGGTQEPAGGVLFQLDPATGSETTLRNFSLAQGRPPAALTVAQSGDVFGTRPKGSFGQEGSTFRLNPATGAYRVLDNLRATRAFAASDPNSGLVVDGTAVYGTTAGGGAAGKGSIFEIIQ